jgi:hypothetical protein
VGGNKIVLKLTREIVFRSLWDQNLSSWGSQEEHKKVIPCMDKKELVICPGPCSTQRQVQKLNSKHNFATRERLLSFNNTQSRVVIGLPTGHSNLR